MSETRGYAERTIAAYRVHAEKAVRDWGRRRTPSRFLKQFAAALRLRLEEASPRASAQPAGGRVLDYGCGTGEEMAWLRAQGFQVEGVDGTLEFLLAARRRCPGARILHARFETIPLPRNRYDGIWCNAALIHVPPPELARQMEKLKSALKAGGLMGLTLAWGRGKRFLRRDWIPGRYLAAYRRDEVVKFLKGWNLQEVMLITGRPRRTSDAALPRQQGWCRLGRWIQILAACDNKKHGGSAP